MGSLEVYPTISVIQVGISPLSGGSLWEAIFVVSQKRIPSPTALVRNVPSSEMAVAQKTGVPK